MIRYLRTASKRGLRGTALLLIDLNAADDSRIRAIISTIRFLVSRGARVVILGHKGRPFHVRIEGGVPKGDDAKNYSLKAESVRIQNILKRRVCFIPHFRFREIRQAILDARPGSVFLLENIRFVRGEDTNDRRVARAFASLADYYVNDAFAASHRNNASISAITRFLPSYAGIGLEGEVKYLSRVLVRPRHPLVIVLGGAKIADKLGILLRFKNKADYFLIGGGAANTLLAMRGVDIGKSLTEENPAVLKKIRLLAKSNKCIVPVDWKVEKDKIVDIGPVTTSRFEAILKNARMIVWNGPMGVTEKKKFTLGTLRIAQAIAANKSARSIVGGGETVVFIKRHKLERKFSFVSTGGGAMLEFLSEKKLPGVEALERANSKAQRARTKNRK